MRELDLLADYPKPRNPRLVGPTERTIENRITASYRDQRYYDGERKDGYGGLTYDGRWRPIANRIISEYQLCKGDAILQIGPEKGFLLYELEKLNNDLNLVGYEISNYAIEQAIPSVKRIIQSGRYSILPYKKCTYDLVIAIGVVYTLNLADAISCLNEIQRVGKGKSFITLAAFYDSNSEYLIRQWSLLGCTILHVNEWVQVLKHVKYSGDYSFVTSDYLNLRMLSSNE